MQALEVIHELQKLFPIKRSPMRLRLTVPEPQFSSLMEKLNAWNANIVSKDQSGNQISVVSMNCYVLELRFLPDCLCFRRFSFPCTCKKID